VQRADEIAQRCADLMAEHHLAPDTVTRVCTVAVAAPPATCDEYRTALETYASCSTLPEEAQGQARRVASNVSADVASGQLQRDRCTELLASLRAAAALFKCPASD